MTFEEFYNDKNNKKMVEILTNKMYYSNRGYYIRKNMEYEEFFNEVIIRVLKYWNYFQEKYNSKAITFIDNTIYRTVNKIYDEMDTQKRRISYDEGVLRIDKEKEENEEEIIIKASEHSCFNENELINKITNKIEDETDRKICLMYLQGMTQKRICEITGYTRRQVEHRINTKYRKVFIETYNEYKNNLVY